MSKSFGSMPVEEQKALIKTIGDLLKSHGINADVQTVQEVVCDIKGDSIEHTTALKVSKELPPSQKDKADAFNAEVKTHIEGITGVKMELNCVVSAGQKYQTIENLTTIDSDDSVNLEHKQGEAWLLDFWATWCPPCQRPMAHNQEMLEKKAEEWKGKVRIIGISIDQGREAVKSHVEDKKWTSVEHFHRSKATCSQVYGVRGVPHVMLINKDGYIVFKGHPATRKNLEEDLDKLMKGEKLEGEGIVEPFDGDAPAAEEKPQEGFKEMDMGEVNKEVTAFKEVCTGFQKNEDLKAAAKDMPRSFCVIVLQESFNPSTGKSSCKYENYRVLVGKQESIDKLKTAFEEQVKGQFEVNNQVRAL